MQCSCGGETRDHKVIRNKLIAGEYAKCTSCGRVYWINEQEILKTEREDFHSCKH